MSAFGMNPKFSDESGFRQWMKEWKRLYRWVSDDIRTARKKLREAQKSNQPSADLQRDLLQQRAMGSKAMTLRKDAIERMESIKALQQSIHVQHSQFPIVIEDAKNITFHFNKKSIEHPFMPAWTLKAKGESYYLYHIDCETAWTTRETPDHPSTKGSLRIKKGTIRIDERGNAVIH